MNKTVVVSGASSGIGFAIANTLFEAGYHVIGLSRSIPKNGFQFTHLVCDITNEDAVKKTVQTISDGNFEIYALINCAGMGISGAVEYTTTPEIQKLFNVNLIGTFQLTKALIPSLRKAPNSKILNIGSVAGALSIPFQAFYCVTKAGINAYTEALRMELWPFGIRVGAILPGDTKTNFTVNREKSPIESDELYHDRIKRSVQRMEHDEMNGKSPMSVAKVCLRLLKRKTVPVFTTVGFTYKLFLFLKRFLPARFLNWVLYQMYGK